MPTILHVEGGRAATIHVVQTAQERSDLRDRIATTIQDGMEDPWGDDESEPASPTLTATEKWLRHRGGTRSSVVGPVTEGVAANLKRMSVKAEEVFAADLDGFEKAGGFEQEFDYTNTSPKDLVRRRSSMMMN